MSKGSTRDYFDALYRKACILQSMVEVLFDRITDTEPTGERDFVVDNLIDAARDLSRELSVMAIEDPEHWEAR
ncbi:hypothetical protein [Aquamicrobium ahrensii]|uniref:Uncharacterized protein n=1 Tax=Aquamicrobium ahrensii TaxID=469551 RepID=A0ABV2KME9_9HYPH